MDLINPRVKHNPLADDEVHAFHHGDASSTSPSASLRPKIGVALSSASACSLPRHNRND